MIDDALGYVIDLQTSRHTSLDRVLFSSVVGTYCNSKCTRLIPLVIIHRGICGS